MPSGRILQRLAHEGHAAHHCHRSTFTACPFSAEHQLNDDLDGCPSHLLGHPRVSLEDRASLYDFLEREFWSDDLERISSKLWWMSKQDSASISPLHRQAVKRRTIIITEDPKLHLTWMVDRIFIKPLPEYLTSYSFWESYLTRTSDDPCIDRIRRAALGYLRTFYYLIQHDSDLRIAQDPHLNLIPLGVSWTEFCNFSVSFGSISDADVSGRYNFGEIRLTRLNLYAPLLLGKTHFQKLDYLYGAYFAHFYGPILFVFGFFSIILSGMQVAISVLDAKEQSSRTNLLFDICLWFSVVIIVCVGVLMMVFACILVFKVGREWRFAIRERIMRAKRHKAKCRMSEDELKQGIRV